MSKNDRYVVKHGSGWAVKAGNAHRASGVYDTQGQAERAAKEIVRKLGGGEVRIQGRMSKNDRYVVKHGSDWAVKADNAQRASGLYDTQRAAEQAAKEIVRNLGGGEVHIQGRHGQFRDSDTVGGGKTATFVSSYLDRKGSVVVDRVADTFGLSKQQLALTVGLKSETLYREKRATAQKTQARMREMLEIVGRVSVWAGGKDQAMAWYRAEPLPAFGGRTAEFLVKDGKAAAVRDYLDHVALGGFA